jgi:hypothetical protein
VSLTLSLSRRASLMLALAVPVAAWGQAGKPPLLEAARLCVGVERLVKLELERRVLRAPRATQEGLKERAKVDQALLAFGQPLRLVTTDQAARVQRATSDAAELIGTLHRPEPMLLSESEAVAARLGLVTSALSSEVANKEHGVCVDLMTRAAVAALRVGKLNFAASAVGGVGVAPHHAILDFRSTLRSVVEQGLAPRLLAELELALNQWLLFEGALDNFGLVKSPTRLQEVATTTDRMAEVLMQLATRVMA